MRKGLDVGLWSSVLDRRVVTARGHFLDILGNRLLSCPRHSRTYHGHPGRPPPGHARRPRSQGDLVGPAARARRRPRHPRLDVRHARGHRRVPVRRPAPPRGARAGGQRVGALRQGEARPLLPAHHRRPAAAEDRDGGVAALVRRGTLAGRNGDIGFAWRPLRRERSSTAIVVIPLALGIGASTAIFSVINGVLLTPLPYREPHRLVMVWETRPGGDRPLVSYRNFEDWRQRQRGFEDIRGYYPWASFTLTAQGDADRVDGALASGKYLQLLGVRPAL